MNGGSFSEHQIGRINIDRYNGYFLTGRVFQVNVNTMERIFEQRSELQVAKCFTVHVLSSGYNASSSEHRIKKKQRRNGAFVSPTI